MVGYALGGIDMALWDALALSFDAPLWKLLGGVSSPIKIYESMGMMSPDDSFVEAQVAASAGVTAFKVKAGHSDPAQDRAVAEVLREVAGPSGDVMFDYNQAFTPHEASRRLAGLVDLDLAWIEEPVAADDLVGHAQVRASTSIPVQTGENLWTAAQLERVLRAGATDLVMLDACRIGLTGWLRAAAVADAHATPLSTHFYPEISTHAMCVTPTAHYVEWLDVSSSILLDPVEVHDGTVSPSDQPGAGITWDQKAIERYDI
jgi:mandelate racemase